MPLTDRTTECDVTREQLAPVQSDAFEVVAHGVDTVSLAWRPHGEDADWWQRRRERLGVGFIDHAAITQPMPGEPDPIVKMRRMKGEGFASRAKFAGGSLLVWPFAHLVAIEGRLADLLPDDDGNGLRPVALIEKAAAAVREKLEWLGMLEGGEPCSVRRLDLTTDVLWHHGKAGAALLDALAIAMPADGHKLNTWTAKHGAETVNLFKTVGKTRRELVGRVYDRGDKTGDLPHGRLIRLERQLRWQSRSSPTAEEVCGSSWREEAVTWLRHLTVRETGAVALDDIERLLDLTQDGTLTPESGLRLLGSLVMRQRRHPVAWTAAVGQGKATERKHRRELAALGLPSASPKLVMPDLEAVLAAASQAWGNTI